MALTPRLEFRQSQSLVMTPQLMQAIKLLQFSHADLQAYVESEIEKNPLLQRGDDQDAGPDRSLPDVADQSPDETRHLSDTNGVETAALMNGAGDDGDWIDKPLQNSAEAIAGTFDTDAENVFPEDAGQAGIEVAAINGRDNSPLSSPMSSLGDNDYNLEAFVSETPTLTDHLTRQIGLVIEDSGHAMIARTLIDSVDNAGYLRSDLSDIAEALGVTARVIEDILGRLQTLDPPGVFARDLSECLALQLKEKNRFDPAIAALIDNLDLLAKREFDRLQSLCGVDRDDLIEMIDEVRMLDPKPGEAFESVFTEIVVPDVIVQARPDGSWALELNSDTLPKVLVDQSYFATVSTTTRNDEEKSYLNDCLQTANWLVKSLDQRAKTILKVASEIVRQQDAFLTHGVQYLKPLNLKTIADAISMHESTVSRVTSNKYIGTPRGIFELKYFFTSAIASSEGGDAHSAEAVRHKIRDLIDKESPKKILSDDALVKLLSDAGIDIARRTVAKYREAMHIPSSVQRRREKRARL